MQGGLFYGIAVTCYLRDSHKAGRPLGRPLRTAPTDSPYGWALRTASTDGLYGWVPTIDALGGEIALTSYKYARIIE